MNIREKTAVIYSSLRRWVADVIGTTAQLQELDVCHNIRGGEAYYSFTARVDFAGATFVAHGVNETELKTMLEAQLEKFNQKNKEKC